MDTLSKAKLLSQAGAYDSCGPKSCSLDIKKGLGGIYSASAEHTNCRMFKTLMSKECIHDCKYCVNRAGCNNNDVNFEPDELARLQMKLNEEHDVNALFLSSAVTTDADLQTEKMLEALRLLRQKYGFQGYVHLKVLPGTSREHIRQGSELANRMSINTEAPSKQHLHELSSTKDYSNDILKRQRWISRMPTKQSTQLIVTPQSSDKEFLKTSKQHYEEYSLSRVYYSAFRPVEGTPMEGHDPTPNYRQQHLYNADFLVRKYGYSYEEFKTILDDENNLPREDPKLALARERFKRPLDINTADKDELLRVPGIGLVTAQRIASHKKRFQSFSQLQAKGVLLRRARPFLTFKGASRQMRLDNY